MVFQTQLRFSTTGRGTYNISQQVNEAISKSGIKTGIAQIFLQHTSASLIMCENADPSVRTDLEAFMARLVPDGDTIFQHNDEGPDDMPAHVRTILSGNSLSIPVRKGKSDLGLWQGVFLWEHRMHPYKRMVSLTVLGE
jgi:secondary thiamine-phosphate synthase enzyme